MAEYESQIIEVTGISKDTSQDALENYFSLPKRGGEITKINYNVGSGKAFITFENAEGAKKALESSPHVLGGCTLTTGKKRVEYVEKDKVYVEGISNQTTEESLTLYMERVSGLEVKDIVYGTRGGQTCTAIVIFESTTDFNKIQEGLRKKPTLEDKAISIKEVPQCKTILVKNLPASATHDSVWNKFESKRAGGDEVEEVNLDLEKKIAAVTFKDPSVIEKVLSITQKLDNTTLTVERYFPILGNLADLQAEHHSLDPSSPDQTTVKPVPHSTALTEEVNRDLYFYLKENHPANLSLALKDPQPKIEMKIETVHLSFASQEAKEHFLSFLNQYKYDIVPFNPILLNHGLREEIKALIPIFSTGKSVMFIEKYEEGFIKLVGRAIPLYDSAIKEVNKVIEKVNKSYEEKKSRREDTIEILPLHIKFLQKSTRFQRLENSLKADGFEMRTDDIKGRITVKGSPTQLQKFKAEIQDIVGRFGERSLNQSRFSFLKTNKALAYVKTLLPTDLLVEVFVNDQGHMMLYGMDDTKVERAYEVIVNHIGELKLPQNLKTKLSQEALLNELGPSIPLTLYTEDADPRILCFKKDVRNLRGKVDDFVERKKTVETRVPLQKVVLRYLELHGENILEGLRLSSPGLKIVQVADALIVSGGKTMVENCCTSIHQFTRGLKIENMKYGKPETSGSIKGMAAKAIIQSIEKKHQCAILVTTKEETDGPSSFTRTPSVSGFNLNEERKRTLQCRYTYPNRKIIEVHQGDILNHPADYLVNSANDELKHSGGLARAIVDRGGHKIQEDCNRALDQLGCRQLMPGEVVTTDGGKLSCKKILHLVVPKNSSTSGGLGEESREARYLRYGCNNVLTKATDGKTIAIPGLGTGIYRVPHEVSAKSLVSTAHEFLTKKTSHNLQEVHFVDNDPQAIEALMTEMLTRFGNDASFEISEPVRDRWDSFRGAASAAPPPTPVIPSGDMAFLTPQGMEIRLTVGNIAKSTTDVIVNTVASDLNLTKNPCSKAVLDEAGNDIATQCEKWIKQHSQVQEGNFAITLGAKLKCKKVFHACCPNYSADTGEKILRQMVQKLLTEVQKLSLTSISIPALGTGTLHFPEKLVATVLFEEAMKFSSDHKSTLKIKQVNIVVYSGNSKAVNTFQEQYQNYTTRNTESTTIPKAKRRTFRWQRKSQTKQNESPEEETHGVKVEIIQGNIVHEATDAIGFLVADDILQGGQIGTAILKAAGEKLVQEYSKLGKIAGGTIVMTTAGNLLARCLLHMVIKKPTIGTDKSMIHEAVMRCLNHADMCGFTSLSLPAVGTGALNQNAKQSAEILYGCIKEYRKRETKSLKLIHIVILQESVFEDFKKAFTRKDPTTDSRGTAKTRLRIILEIAADSMSDITKIKEELGKFEEERTLSKKIEIEQKLDDRQLAEILELQDHYEVRIECNPEIGFMRISGLAENVANACDAIRQKIFAWEQERHHTEATVREVQWFYYEGNKDVEIPAKYADSISAKIERAFNNRASCPTFTVGDDLKYRIDFTTMTETCLDTNDKMKVYRRQCEAFPLPSHWEHQPINCSTGVDLQVHCVTLDQLDDSTEYKKIQDMIVVTLPKVVIREIERVQNPRLYQIYEGQKAKMINGGNEMQLFHGTSQDAVVNINSTGFNRNFCGKNAVRLGRGAYFANRAVYSAQNQYATPGLNGWQQMYVARVLVGKYTRGNASLLEPPLIDDSNPNIRYDSVVDNVQNPGIFVIFHDFQAYPEYLVTFKKS